MKQKTNKKEVKIMRKMIIISFIVLLSLVMFNGVSDAAVSGTCSSCHTMHDSQANSGDEGSTGLQGNLLLYSCLACHTTGGSAFAPKIDGTAATTGIGTGTSMLAGGDLDLGATASTRHDIQSGDSYAMDPPGYASAGTALTWTNKVVTCDGEFGCHGTHNSGTPTAGVNGMHHDASEASYRFLYVQDGNSAASDGTAVGGKESTTWEAGGATMANHNVYDGDTTNSISSFCSNCHAAFHATTGVTGSASPFTRHPTDEEAVIANIDGSGLTMTDAMVNETPFGFTDAQVGTMATTTMTGYTSVLGKAICVSCHRAHGTAQTDILRFDYATMDAGSGVSQGGCETCHTAQQ